MQEHWPLLQIALGPHGDGLQGSFSIISGTEKVYIIKADNF